jgi:hypothetical protein
MVTETPELDETPPETPPKVVEITQALIGAVATKVDDGSANFNDDEKAVMQTIFALAAKGLSAFPGPVSCVGDLTIRIGDTSISVERRVGSDVPKMSESFTDSFCPGKLRRYDIEGLEVDKSAVGSGMSSGGAASAKSVAAAAGAKSVAATAGAKSVAAATAAGAKSVAATAAGAKSVAATAAGAKSVAATAAGAKSVAATAAAGAKSVAAAGAKSVAAVASAAESVAAQAACLLKPVPANAVYLHPGYRIERCSYCRTARFIPSFVIGLNRCFSVQRCA